MLLLRSVRSLTLPLQPACTLALHSWRGFASAEGPASLRTDHDTLALFVPAEKLWGIQTQRGLQVGA
jgi:hypothetical protein